MSVNIKYKGSTIAEITESVTKTLKTSGKYCEADIVVENTQDGGGASLPSVISKIDGGSFNPASNIRCDSYDIQHNMGVMPKGAIIWCQELMDSETAPQNFGVVYAFISFLQIATTNGGYTYGFNHWYRRATAGGASLRELTFSSEKSRSNSATTTTFKHNVDDNYYFAGKTYNWFAWA